MAEKTSRVSYAKTDSRYWLSRVFRGAYSQSGKRVALKSYSVRIQYRGHRHEFALGIANKQAASRKAAEIYVSLVGKGWEETLAIFALKPTQKREDEGEQRVATVGEFLDAVESIASVRPRTLSDYARAFRHIVSDIEKISSLVTQGKKTKDIRYDYRSGAREAWIAKINAVSLATLTPEKVQKWKLRYVKERGEDPVRCQTAKLSANSTMRQAKALFAPKILKFVGDVLLLPDPLPFAGVDFFPVRSTRYVSRIDPAVITQAAFRELRQQDVEAFKIFLFALGAGLRAGEIDCLLWRQVQLDRRVIVVEATEFHVPKADSSGEVDIDPELVALLREYHASASGAFVIESHRLPNRVLRGAIAELKSISRCYTLGSANKGSRRRSLSMSFGRSLGRRSVRRMGSTLLLAPFGMRMCRSLLLIIWTRSSGRLLGWERFLGEKGIHD